MNTRTTDTTRTRRDDVIRRVVYASRVVCGVRVAAAECMLNDCVKLHAYLVQLTHIHMRVGLE